MGAEAVDGGVINPTDLSEARILSLEKTENMDLNSEDLDCRAPTSDGEWEDESMIPDDVGRALSLALKLKNKNNGTSQTQMPKKVAMSLNPGALGSEPRCL